MTTVSTCWFLQHFCSKTKNNSLQLKGSLGGGPKPKEQSISKLNLKMILFLCFRDSYLPSAGIKAVYHIPEKKQSNKPMAHFTMYSQKVQTHNPMCQSLWVNGSIQFTYQFQPAAYTEKKLLFIKTLPNKPSMDRNMFFLKKNTPKNLKLHKTPFKLYLRALGTWKGILSEKKT